MLSQHMRLVGNIKSNEMYNPNEVRHPPPANTIDLARDSEIEKFIRGT
jgi:stromal membrane-associated protein